MNTIKIPIGFESIKKELNNFIDEKNIYQNTDLTPGHLIVNLDPGFGRSTLANYITNLVEKYKLLDLDSGIRNFIEIKFDGTYKQFQESFSQIREEAIYKNKLSHVISLEIENLLSRNSEINFDDFIDNCIEFSNDCLIIFFVNYDLSDNELSNINKLMAKIPNIKTTSTNKYTHADYTYIIISSIEDYMIQIQDINETYDFVQRLVNKENVKSIEDAKTIAKDLLKYVDFENRILNIDNIQNTY